MKSEIISSTWLIFSQFVRLTVGVFIGIYIAKVIGPADYGAISFSLSVLGFLTPLVLFGQQSVLPRLIHLGKHNSKNLLLSSLTFTVFSSVVVFILFSVVFFLTTELDNYNFSIFIIISSSLFLIKDVYIAYNIALSKGKIIFFGTLFSLSIINIARLIIVENSNDLFYIAITYPIEYFLFFCVYFIFTKQNKKLDLKLLRPNWKIILVDGWPLILSGISLSLNQRLDQLFLKWKLGFDIVGNYAASVKIVEIITIIPYLIARGTFPYFMRKFQKNIDIYYFEISVLYKIAFSLGILTGLTLFFLSENVILLLFGNKYNEAIPFLKIYSFSLPFSFVGAVNSLHLKVVGQFKSIMGRQGLNLILNLTLNFILIDMYGAVGAAYSTLIALVNSTIVYDLINHKNTNINKLKFYVFKNID